MSQSYRVLIIDDVHPLFLDEFSMHEVKYLPNISKAELSDTLNNAEVLVMRSKLNFDSSWIDKSPDLKVIGRLGSGMDNIDVDYAESKGIVCLNAPEGNRASVAEQTIGMMLSLFSNIVCSSKEVSQGVWDRKKNVGTELSSKTVGIIGYGNTGSALASRLIPFGCEILAYDLYKKDYGSDQVRESTLEYLWEQADVISLHIPLNDASYHLVNKEFIFNMKNDFYLFNLSRGDVVHTTDCLESLVSSKILGMGLDVYENENIGQLTDKQRIEFESLVNHPRVIMTPHIGGLTRESYKRLAQVLAAKIKSELK